MPISAPPPSWASIKNKPNTVSGFGITDMASQSVANATNATNVSNVTTAQVANATAGISAGGVGSYVWGLKAGSATAGSTYAGSGIWFTGIQSNNGAEGSVGTCGTGGVLSGTWRAVGLGNASYFPYSQTLFLRIA